MLHKREAQQVYTKDRCLAMRTSTLAVLGGGGGLGKHTSIVCTTNRTEETTEEKGMEVKEVRDEARREGRIYTEPWVNE